MAEQTAEAFERRHSLQRARGGRYRTAAACKMDLEGIVSKCRDGGYEKNSLLSTCFRFALKLAPARCIVMRSCHLLAMTQFGCHTLDSVIFSARELMLLAALAMNDRAVSILATWRMKESPM